MRFAIVGPALLIFSISAYAQAPPCSPVPYRFDPYNPSDVAILRQYGGVVMSQVPLATLLSLDPYVPFQAELLRQVGSGIPLWGYPWFPWHVSFPSPPAVPLPDCSTSREPNAEVITTFADMLTALERERTAAAPSTPTAAGGATASQRNKGVWIQYAGRVWINAGPAVPFRDGEFVRVGESSGLAIFRRTGAKDDVIYVPTTKEMVAPFRLVP